MIVRVLLIVLGVFVVWQALIRAFRKLLHFPAPAFLGRVLDSDYRRKLQPPDKLIQRSGVKEGMQALEVGCGSGGYTTYVARVVGGKGKVYALDIQPGMLRQLENKLRKPENQDVKNVQPVRASAHDLPFEDGSLDLVYMITVLQEIPDRRKALQEAKRVLKPGGFLAVTELLPDPDYVFKSDTVRLGRKAGFELDEAAGSLWTYTVRFVKP
jgi:ubiquinone/menaquinone biosynthesis C-methylase UbiE